MPSSRHLVVVGASLAGLRAVEGARKTGFTGAITLVGAEPHLPYDRPPLSKGYLEPGMPPDTPVFRTEQTLRDELGVALVLGAEATALDTIRRVVEIGDRGIEYDAAVIATGAVARTLRGNAGLPGVHTLRTIEDAIAIRAALDSGARTVVIGAGFIGSEIASGARKRGLPVTVIEAQPTPLVRAVGEEMGAMCASLHQRNGTDLRCGVSVARVEGEHHVERVALSDGTSVDADLVVAGVGAVPATDWLHDSGLRLSDGVVCDETLFAGAPGVYAAGDVARWHNPLFERPMRLEHWTSAAEQGALAARNAVEPATAKPYATVPYFWSDLYGNRIQFVGIADADEVRMVDGDLDRDARCVALYRAGGRLVGAFAINGQSVIMKYRSMITTGATWSDALDFAGRRRPAVSPPR
ncbi:NAD(P)/FAD-dependent oxidoreductase [Amycolatopsis sp.]|jgi:NADPH-dependent 2,4-dienoyl-CoA reductase/sulfur reductase-like enzyme|uniref:NAD(P)/FAD-dependent oxidoreductase n=1 Tax=Amycolatopsis sp. TaxID=37632 RepID=UPI002DF8DC17|nr:FAD-dependent oxidoreductase [Amycolatopsis sp.]